MGAPDLDHHRGSRLRDPAGLAERRHHVRGEEERVEAGHEIEAIVALWKALHLADPEIGVGQATVRDGDQRLGRIEAGRLASAIRDELEKGADPAADVEDALTALEPDPVQRRLVRGSLLVFADRPVSGRAPQSGPQRPALPAVVMVESMAMTAPSNRLCNSKF